MIYTAIFLTDSYSLIFLKIINYGKINNKLQENSFAPALKPHLDTLVRNKTPLLNYYTIGKKKN